MSCGPTHHLACDCREAEFAALRAALAEAREVLRPFANAAACLDDDEHDSVLVLRWKWNGREVDIVNGDLRRAIAFLECLSAKAVGSFYGVKSGWFSWPFDFDPTWLLSCSGFAERKSDK